MQKQSGYTLVEVLIVISLLAIIAVTSSAAIINYYRTSITDSELRQVTARLQIARQSAIGNSSGEPYSVKFLNNSYIIFPGSTYSINDPDNKSYALETSLLVSTTFTNDVITFDNFTGRTGQAGVITLSAYGVNSNLVINELGIVEDIN